jgi:hypothetical protein
MSEIEETTIKWISFPLRPTKDNELEVNLMHV